MICNGTGIITNGVENLAGNIFTSAEYLSGYMFEVFLYGIAFLVFFIAAFSLVYNLRGYLRWLLLTSATLMFAVSTTNVSLNLYSVFGIVMHQGNIPDRLYQLRHVFYFVNNLIADLLLMYRCYVIWSHSFRIIIAPCVLFLASFGVGVFYVSSSGELLRSRGYIYVWMALTFNIMLTALIAGRIWWMARQARKILGPTMARRYYSAMVVIIESGAIYSLYVLIDQVLKTVADPDLLFLDAGLTQVVTIAPTLIIVQVGLGRQARDLESTLDISRDPSGVVFTTIHSD